MDDNVVSFSGGKDSTAMLWMVYSREGGHARQVLQSSRLLSN